ncbi:MAG TPA: LysR family transcriptional regulator [Thermoanaerobaculia bacterium]|nr:LysR family transcriptional regulator [Thermoanaerobaculia bacterium]
MRSINAVEAPAPFRPVPLEVRHLRLVVAIVEEGGLSRAGERLNLTQSALSHQLRQVEESLGVSLFTRAKKRLVLTPAGEELVERARRILADIVDLERDLRERASGYRGKLRLATHCYTLYEWLPPLLKRFYRTHPNVDVEIIADATADPLAALRQGQIDLAIISSHPDEPDVTTFELFRDELLLLVPPSHRFAQRSYVTAKDFTDEHLLLYSAPSDNHFYQSYLARSAAPPRKVTMIKLTEAILSMVRAGLGVTVAARWAVADELRTGRLVGVRIGSEGFFREWSAAVRASQRAVLPHYFADFVDLVARAAAPVRLAVRQSS